jgi:hypothetical protein
LLTYRRRFVVRGEEWFDARDDRRGVDVHEVFHVLEPLAGYRCVEFNTIEFDLSASEDALFAKLRPEARRQIRRCAEGGEVIYERFFPCDGAQVGRFFAAYDDLASHKGLAPLDRELTTTYAKSGVLDLSLVRTSDGRELAWHANYRTLQRARQLHSIAFFRDDKAERQMIGRAHRFQTWRDILAFKEAGIPIFDLGGWYHGKTDAELLKVNAFKEEFGGEIVRRYICERGLTLRGKVYVALRNLKGEGMFNAVARGAAAPRTP